MSALDRTTRPGSGPVRQYDFPEVARRALPNGLDLRVARMSRLPMVSVRLFMRSGESALRAEQGGLAVATGDAVEGGTKRHSGTELAEALERIGARLDVGAGWEGTSVGLSCLAERLPDALAILAEMATEPAFPQDEVERTLQQHLASIHQRANDPGSLASDSALPRYFAEGVPYRRPVDGTAASMQSIGRDDLRGYADANYRPEGGGLVVAGDVDIDEVAAMARDHLGGWTGAPATVADFTVEPESRERGIWIVHRPGAVQSEIRIGHVGVSRSTPDYFALSVANMALGGVFTSRLNLNLREEHGFTYGIRSRFVYRSRGGMYQVGTAVGTDVTPPAVREIVGELTKMADGGPTEEEVRAVRDYSAGIFGLQLETAGQVATRVAQLVIYGLPDGYFQDYRDAVRAVSTDEAAAAAQAHIRPNEAQIVIVGDAEEIAEPLRALDLGPVEVEEG